MIDQETTAVFLTGYSKSGTTLLLSLLDGHPELCIFPKESEFFKTARSEIQSDRGQGVATFWKRSFENQQFGMEEAVQLPVAQEEYLAELDLEWLKCGYELGYFLQSAVLAYGNLTGQSGRKFWVEKTPGTEAYASEISKHYPRAKMIYIVRDPRANYSAIKTWKIRNGEPSSALNFAYWWARSIVDARRAEKYFPVLTVRYEELVVDTLSCSRRICEFLGISFHDALTSPTIGGTAFGGNSQYWKSLDGVDTRPLGRWRNELSSPEVELIEGLLIGLMNELDYGTTSAGLRSRLGISVLRHLYAIWMRLPSAAKHGARVLTRPPVSGRT